CRNAPSLSDAALLKAIDCHDRLLKRSTLVGRGQLPAHGDAIALLDHIQDFQVYRRHQGSESRCQLDGPVMSLRQGRGARLVKPEILGEPNADAISSAGV